MSFVYRIFLKGLLALLPITITIYLLVWIATTFESAFGGPLRRTIPGALDLPGVGVIVGLITIFVVGLLVNNLLTHRIIRWFESRLEEMPVIRSIYSPIRDITQLFSKTETGAQQRVVMVQPYGPLGGEVLGLVTRDHFGDFPEGAIAPDSVAVFIPLSYAMGGSTMIFKRTQIRETGLNADRAMQLALTAWIKTQHS